ncbi:transposase [Streptomyces sp. SHP 1-2]|uniref:transposase n=1 Tax=Streptomyces sp. SHP 1-2 TaxID=2769489 RepID=UPI002237CF33|nr:transposase [Streptomyces sp. SHP 1-2]MCW5254326.1 transposase [Streptomyces sp. SHP 1-2]
MAQTITTTEASDEIAALHQLATVVLNEHTNDHGLCAVCGCASPCAREASPWSWTPGDWDLRFQRNTGEFKRDAVALADSSGRTVTAVARELGISSESLRGWYRRAKADQGEGAPGELTGAEREEFKRLRRENREQLQTIEILKRATAFFARESDR